MTVSAISRGERRALFAPLECVSHAGLAVSGGADSTALMHLVRLWRDEKGAGAPRLSVLTVDHGLREGSMREAAWVAARSEELGLKCAVLRWRPGEKRSRIQADARAARYNLMAAHAHANKLDALVTAHHLDDQAETLLMRLARGSGVDGLAGIPRHGTWAGLPVIRPFLDVPRVRLAASLDTLGETWLEDPSNDDARFERVRLRKAMDELERQGIGADALAMSAKRLRRAAEALELAAGEFLALHGRLDEAGFCRIAAEAFAQAPEETAIRALARALAAIGGRAETPRLAKVEALAAALRSGEAKAQTLAGCAVSREGGEILILREAGRGMPEGFELAPGETALWDNRYKVSLDAGSRAPVEVKALGRKGLGEVRARLGKPVTLPPRAADALVSFWRGDEVLAVPPLGYAARPGCRAKLVNRELFSGAR